MRLFVALASPEISTVVRDKIPAHMLPKGKPIRYMDIAGIRLGVFHLDNEYETWYYEKGSQQYLVNMNTGVVNNRDYFRQTNVWQENMKGTARRVMDALSAGSNVLVSSSTQRRRGVTMWKKYLRDVYGRGQRHIYLLNKGQLTPVTSEVTLNFLIESAWQGNAGNKVWIIAEQPVLEARLPWH